MKLRLFIGLKVESDLRKKIQAAFFAGDSGMSREQGFLHPNDWHITVIFLGFEEPETIPGILRAIKKAAEEIPAPKIKFTEISYNPKKRMLWLNCDEKSSKQIGEIKEYLEDKLHEFKVPFKRENRRFYGHITLLRLKGGVGEPPDSLTWNSQEIFRFKSLILMQSLSKKSEEKRYTELQSFDFSRIK